MGKVCTKCGKEKPVEEFHWRDKSRGTKHRHCKTCHNARNRAWYARNSERIREAEAAYRERNRKTIRQNYARWRKRHPGRDRIHSNAWNKRNPEMVKAWYDKYRANMRDAFVERVYLDEMILRDEGRCGICGEPIMGPLERDHIVPLAAGGKHERSNVQIAHPACNRRKWARMDYPKRVA